LAGEPASQLSRQIGDNSQHLGYYLPKWEDYENTRRKLLRKGEKRVSTNKLLDIMQNDLVAAGYKLLQSWRSETKKNIEVWRQRKD
ncbi:MAG TPA: hypothetical protein PKM17_12155, partial [Syntrophorhabdus sp.]|nr:hypothetical protein [Syntrophorhabdus sp.]